MSTTSTGWPGATSISFSPAAGRVAIGFVLLAALTVTWNGIKLPAVGVPADIFILLSLVISGFMVVFGDLRFSVPIWQLIPCLAILMCVLVRQFDPAPYYLRVLRFQVQGYKPESATKALFWLFAILIVPLAIIACIAIERRAAVWTMGAYVTGATLSSVVAITDLTGVTPHIGRSLAAVTGARSSLFNADLSDNRVPGLSDHPNTLGFTAVLSIPIVIYFIGTMRRKWIGAIALIVLFGGILACGSRGAQAVAPLVALAAMLWMPNRRSLTRVFSISALAVVVAGVLLLVSLPSDVRQGVFRVIQGVNSDQYAVSAISASDAERLSVLRNGVADWQLYPVFGAGIRHIVEAHNIYVQLLAAGGVVLAVAMLVYWFWMLRDCWRLSKLGIVYARFLMLSIGSWLILGMVENFVTDRYVYFAIGCVAGLASVNLTRWQDRAQAPDGMAKAQRQAIKTGEREGVSGLRR